MSVHQESQRSRQDAERFAHMLAQDAATAQPHALADFYRSLVEHADQMVARLTADGRYLYVSPACKNLLGYSPEEMIGHAALDFIHPDDRARTKTFAKDILKNGKAGPVEYRRRHRDGSYVWVETAARLLPLGSSGEGHVVTTTRSVADRRAAEDESQRVRRLLETIYDNIEACLWITEVRDGEFYWVYNNPADRALTGMDLCRPGGVRFEEVLPPEAAEYNRRRCQEVLDTGHKVTFDDCFDRNGERRWSWNTLIPVRESDGRISQIVGTGIDVTQRREAERAVLRAVEHEQRRIGQDLHDGLLQQMSGVLFMVQLLERHLEKGASELAREAREIGELLSESVSQARRLSHGLFPAQVEKDGLPRALEQLAESTVERCDIPCFFELHSDRSAPGEDLRRDLGLDTETHLFRIAQESVANAVRHAEASEIGIQLIEENGRVVLRVYDDGKGIDEKIRGKGGMGLRSMEYRANLIGASLVAKRKIGGKGTEVRCQLSRTTSEVREPYRMLPGNVPPTDGAGKTEKPV